MIEESFQTVSQKVALFEHITLAEMESVKLMNRTDAKFLIPLWILPVILDDLRPHYRILEVN